MRLGTRTFTYETRISEDNFTESDSSGSLNSLNSFPDFADEYSKLYGEIQRYLFSEYSRGKSLVKIKPEVCRKYGITARHYNAVRVSLEGKIKSRKECQSLYISETKGRIKATKARIKALEKRLAKASTDSKVKFTDKAKFSKLLNEIHQKRRALAIQEHKLALAEKDKKNNVVRLCFGTKRLFNKQFNLEANGYQSHAIWKKGWKEARGSEFFLVGSKDETAGNQSCIATLNEDGTINLKIRVPDRYISRYGKYLELSKLHFNHGHEAIVLAIKENLLRNNLSHKKSQAIHGDLFKKHGAAISYRFRKDAKGWRVFVTTDVVKEKNSDSRLGRIGVDINQNHLAVCDVDRTGNYKHAFNIPLCTYGKSTHQSKAIAGDAVKILVEYAKLKNKAIVIEKLDFSKKKQSLRNESKRRARQLSAFSYSLIIQTIESKAFRCGIEVRKVNPAYSSVIGRVKFASNNSRLSVHTGAALALARRNMGCSKRLPRGSVVITNTLGGHFTLPLLVKNKAKHEWSKWADVSKQLKAAHVEQYQMYRSSA